MDTAISKHDAPDRDAQWEPGPLDIEAYLARIGHEGPVAPTIDTLRALQRAHLDAIAFENLDVILGRDITLDLASLQTKLVRSGRGGYCHEQNILFATVLDRLGFHVGGRSARMLMGDDERTLTALGHTMLNVHVDGTDWHVDVGVGNVGPREPIALREGNEVRHDAWWYRLDRTAAGRWLLRHRRAGGWFNIYQFNEQAYYRVDYGDHNYLASRHPDSAFVRRIVAQRNRGDVRHALVDRELKVFRPDADPDVRTVDPGEIPGLLREVFGLQLPGEAMERIVRRAKGTSADAGAGAAASLGA